MPLYCLLSSFSLEDGLNFGGPLLCVAPAAVRFRRGMGSVRGGPSSAPGSSSSDIGREVLLEAVRSEAGSGGACAILP